MSRIFVTYKPLCQYFIIKKCLKDSKAFTKFLTLGYADEDYTKVVCTNGIHKVYVAKAGGIEIVNKRRGSSNCQINFIFPEGSGFTVNCPEMNLKKDCNDEYLSFKETKKLGYIGGSYGYKEDYSISKEGQEGVRYVLQARYKKKSKNAKSGFRCLVSSASTPVGPPEPDDSLCDTDVGFMGCFHKSENIMSNAEAVEYCNNYFGDAGGSLYFIGENNDMDLGIFQRFDDSSTRVWARANVESCLRFPSVGSNPAITLYDEIDCDGPFPAFCVRD